jgi:hypothetical protein
MYRNGEAALPNAVWASKETEALDFILTEIPGLRRTGDARLHAESPPKVDFWIQLHQDAADGTRRNPDQL